MEEYQGALCESGLSSLATGSASKGPAEVTINEAADWVRKSRRVKPGNFALLRLMFMAPESVNETSDEHRYSSRLRAFVVKPAPNSPRRHEDAKLPASLPDQLQSELNNARVAGAGNHAETALVDKPVRRIPLRVVERIEELRAELGIET